MHVHLETCNHGMQIRVSVAHCCHWLLALHCCIMYVYVGGFQNTTLYPVIRIPANNFCKYIQKCFTLLVVEENYKASNHCVYWSTRSFLFLLLNINKWNIYRKTAYLKLNIANNQKSLSGWIHECSLETCTVHIQNRVLVQL